MASPLPLPAGGHRPRIALYGHDTLGLGHLRRNLALAEALAADTEDGPGADVLLLTGATEVGMFERPHGVDVLVVPGVRKDEAGDYAPRRLRTSLSGVLDLRRSMLGNALLTFAPDLLVIDKSPWGFGDELADVLGELRHRGTRLVLGLRDVLDEPAVARRQWSDEHADEAVATYYDEVWVYGDEDVHDLTVATGMSTGSAARTHHVGYLAEGRPGLGSASRPTDRPYVLVTVGGGQDGADVLRCAAALPPRPGYDLVLVTGPQLDRGTISELRSLAEDREDLQVHRFSRHGAAWAAHAAAVVCMGGANTVAEQLVTEVPTLVVPRVEPRLEQWVRADALSRRGALDVLHPAHLCAAALDDWLREHLGTRVDRSGLRLGGLRNVRRRAAVLVEEDDVAHPAATLTPQRLAG